MKDRELIEQLELYRLERRLTQREIAKLLQISFATVNRWFNGRNYPNKIQMFHITKLIRSKLE